jgi:mannose-1-phosphate guanylyltransferase/mannose-6-phosphate isomerase
MLWNAGIFLCTRSTLRHSLEIHASDIATACKTAMSQSAVEPFKEKLAFIRPSKEAFATSPANSIDYAVMENHENVTVVPFTGQWSDVGSWNAIADLTESDEQQNRIEGNGLTHLSENTYIHASNRLVVSIGTKDLMIIDTTDAVLVVDRSQAEKVKDVWAELENKEYKEATEHRKVYRPWGWYDSVDNGDRFQVKRICVKPGAKLSLQKHFHRAEHWIVVRGTAEVTRGEETFLLSENQSTYIPIGTVHRLANPGKINLEMIEVQSGRYLGEDDIVRLEDTYGRMASEPDEVS